MSLRIDPPAEVSEPLAVCSVKGRHRYVVLFRVDQYAAAIRSVRQWARSGDLNFDERDALAMRNEIVEACR